MRFGELVLEVIAVGPLQANCSVLVHPPSGEGVVFDCGGDAAKVLKAARRLGCTQVTAGVFTHGHFDHTLGARDFVQATGAPLAIHAFDAAMLRDARKQMSDFHRRNASSSRDAADDEASVGTWPEPQRLLKEGDVVRIGTAEGTVLETPGHTRGSCCIHFAAEGLLIAGDTLFLEAFGRTDLPGGSEQAMARTLKRLFALPPDTYVISGHGESTTIGHESTHNIALHLGFL